MFQAPFLSPLARVRLGASQARSAFFFGHIAPDVQVISRQKRETTHFLRLPPVAGPPSYVRLLDTYPSLAPSALHASAHVAFLCGYVAHLLLDERWIREIFHPVFGIYQTWGDRRERILLHNALRTWLDQRARPRLEAETARRLRQAQPSHWLPFASDADLCHWRDLVADQLAPGAAMRTVEIFAQRCHVSDAEFQALLRPDVMREKVFSRISVARIDQFFRRAIERACEVVTYYLNDQVVEKASVQKTSLPDILGQV